jgi:hypothetical protein
LVKETNEMKILKIALILIAALIVALAVINKMFTPPQDPVEKDIETIKNIATMFKGQLENLGVDKEVVNDVILKLEEYNEEAKYVIAFNIKNDTNPILGKTLHLPVEEEFFNSVEIGDVVAAEELEKINSFTDFNVNIGDWTVVVNDKIIRE